MPDAPTSPTRFDPGWLFLAAGMALLAATVLIPAREDVERVRWQRDRALAVEAQRQRRLTRYEEYLAALDNQDSALISALAESQLRQIPVDRSPVPVTFASREVNLSVYPGLEPEPIVLKEFEPTHSMLADWSRDPSKRIWLIVGGAVSVLLGILPASRGWGAPAPTPAA